jgi:EAL domain-containing protein (putative c-di-GMP-specific phosphodiesterase class I)/GGDEF domain-containing protein/PAS domain-containing protein
LQEAAAVPVLVHSSSRDSVEELNSLLRNNGMAAHCTWIPAAADIGDALEQINPELLVSFNTPENELIEIASIRDQIAQSVPLVVLRETSDEAAMSGDMQRGARDSATMLQPDRVTAIIRRELRAFRMERTLTNTLEVAQDYRQRLQSVLWRSQDAIAQINDGIIVDANASWLELFGHVDSGNVVGHPIMDFFDADTQTSLRGAVAACMRGRWSELPLKVGALLADKNVQPMQVQLMQGEFDSEPCVQIIVPADRRDEKQLASDLAAAVHQDPSSGLWTRRRLLELITTQLATPVAGGARFLVCLRPDNLMQIERDVGVLHTDEFLAQFASVIRGQLGPKDLLGHFGGTNLLLLAERGNARDLEAWCTNVLERVAKHTFAVGDRALSATCSAGASQLPNKQPDLNESIMQSLNSARVARDSGGNRLNFEYNIDHDTRVRAYDEVWVRHIRAALADERFRLVQHPIASLSGDGQKVFDASVRMLDHQGKDVLPSEFLPAASRNGLQRTIDRWVLGAAIKTILEESPDILMVRLSSDSIKDSELVEWLQTRLQIFNVEPTRICLQFTEADCAANSGLIRQRLQRLRQLKLRTALEHFGTRSDSLNTLSNLPLDFVKIDGSLMQALAGNTEQQEHIRRIAETASRLHIQTVAERIEDANTMAIVWQLGVQYIQGYLVHAPEEVVLTS